MAEDKKPQAAPTKRCFVISPIGADASETRDRSDTVLEYIIKPAAIECGYVESDVVRADMISNPGMITSQIIEHILEDHLVIADLTDHNPNVFYELAIRHAIRKPIIHMILRGQEIPFDVKAFRSVTIDLDIKGGLHTREQLIKHIRSSNEDPTRIETPITNAIDLKGMRESKDPAEKTLAKILGAITGLERDVATIKKSQLAASSPAAEFRNRPFDTSWLAPNTVNPLTDILGATPLCPTCGSPLMQIGSTRHCPTCGWAGSPST